MNEYKTPESDLIVDENRIYSPIKAVVYGLCVSIILVNIVSLIEVIIFGAITGLDFSDENTVEAALSNSSIFMVSDIVVSALVLFFAGIVIGKHVPGKESKFGIIVSIITVVIYFPLFFVSDAFVIWPFWYNFFGMLAVSAIYFGAKSKSNV